MASSLLTTKSFYGGQLRSCDYCRRRQIKCTYPPNELICERCISFRVPCSGPTKSRSSRPRLGKKLSSKESKCSSTNISPTSTRGRLTTFTLSCALTYHLVSEDLKYARPRKFLASDDVNTFQDLLGESGGSLSGMSDFLEITCIESMCRAAATTTHSAVVGSALSTPALASLALMQDKTVISRAAISRVALYELLQTKITTHMENLAREILQLPLETATTKLNLVFSAWTVLNEYSDLEIPSSVLDCVRTLARKLPELLSGTALTTMERGGLGEMLHQIQLHERELSKLLRTTSLLPRPPTQPLEAHLPSFYHYTPQDIEYALYYPDTDSLHKGPPRTPELGRAIFNRWIEPIVEWDEAFVLRMYTLSQIHTPSERAEFFKVCCEACEDFLSFCDGEVAKIFEDVRYQGPRGLKFDAMAHNTIRFAVHMETRASLELFNSEDYDQERYSEQTLGILTRLAHHCDTMKHAGIDPRLHLSTLASVSKVVGCVDPLVIRQFCTRCRSDASSLLDAIQLSGFSRPSSVAVSIMLEEAMKEARKYLCDKTDALKMVENVLWEMGTGAVVSSC